MSYLIYKSDGTAVTIPDNAIDATFYDSSGGGGYGPGNVPQAGHGLGQQLVGRNAVDYGAAIAQNFLQLTENFSSSTVPNDSFAMQGQLWFKQNSTTTGDLYVRITANTSGGILNWSRLVVENTSGDLTVTNDLIVTGTITAEGGNHVPVVFSSPPGGGVAVDGDILVVGSVISVYAGGSWRQVYPAVYS